MQSNAMLKIGQSKWTLQSPASSSRISLCNGREIEYQEALMSDPGWQIVIAVYKKFDAVPDEPMDSMVRPSDALRRQRKLRSNAPPNYTRLCTHRSHCILQCNAQYHVMRQLAAEMRQINVWLPQSRRPWLQILQKWQQRRERERAPDVMRLLRQEKMCALRRQRQGQRLRLLW